MRLFSFAILAGLFSVGEVVAGDAPEFLKGRTFATDVPTCAGTTEGDGLQLTKDGIYGPEFACVFVGFAEDRDKETGRVYSVIATSSCGDDSGINRSDLITLSPYIEGGQVIVQSQNEYVISEVEYLIASKLGKQPPEKSEYAWVSQTYNLCE